MKWLTLSGRFAPSSPEGRAFDKTANSAGNAKASHFGGGGSALALTERFLTAAFLRKNPVSLLRTRPKLYTIAL